MVAVVEEEVAGERRPVVDVVVEVGVRFADVMWNSSGKQRMRRTGYC